MMPIQNGVQGSTIFKKNCQGDRQIHGLQP